MSNYTVWTLADIDQDLWLPTRCDTFDQAGDAWLQVVQAGGKAIIMQEVAVAVKVVRAAPPKAEGTKRGRGRTPGSLSEQVRAALKEVAPDGLSRQELAKRLGASKTRVGAATSGLLKDGVVRVEQVPPSDERGVPAPGRSTVSVYVWKSE